MMRRVRDNPLFFSEVAHFFRNATSLSATKDPLTLEALHQKPTF
jgi:hypothetical protein